MAEEQKVNHLAVILDGNRRYAKQRNMPAFMGHEKGAETLQDFLPWCKEFGIKKLTLYTLSTENLKRDKLELDFLFALFKRYFKKVLKSKEIENEKVRIRFIGDLSLLPKDLTELCLEVEEKTKDYANYSINFCIAYGGRLELVKAFNKLKNQKKDITEEDISNALWLKDEPDLIIRTGDAMRSSNFLPWQSVYSEWIFLEKMWPEFTKQDLISALKTFESRKRNFGK